MIRRWLGLIALVLASACSPAPDPHVALWAVVDHGTTRGWILGTVHALPPGTRWRSAAIDDAMARADRLVLEIGEPLDPARVGAAMARRAVTPGLPPPSARLDLVGRAALIAAYARLELDDARFKDQESWAVAVQVSAIASARAGVSVADGVEPQVRALMPGKAVIGLETVDGQFAVFDALPLTSQNHLLVAVAQEANDAGKSEASLLAQWRKGDEAALERSVAQDFLGDPALRDALLTARNRAWSAQIDALLRSGARPLIAVGAGHVVGRDGLPAQLRARGWTVRRVS